MLFDFKQDEHGRIGALERLEILDSSEEKPFEKIVTLVEQVLQVPICAVSLVDRDRQWFKARRGLGVCETARDISFCTHAIQSTEPYIVRDALQNPLFAHNPLVTGEPHIRSYAGVPLQTSEGYVVGTLCAIDTKAREFPPQEIEILKNFTKVVVDELELRKIASTDVLSGALSRRAWMEKAKAEVKRSIRYDRPLSLMIMDIDHFKSVNDTYGHAAGDVVIKKLAELAQNSIRETDSFGRYGGEEFVLLLPETSTPDALKLAERIRSSFSSLSVDELEGTRTTISVGLTQLRDRDDKLNEMIERADKALYEGKQSGRNCCITSVVEPEQIDRRIA
uniref:sensor domain-containing diguanylate cyclase n=1 Tax=Pararhizobium sp. IMCC3301 TaxID=3067904 RepID=UPI0027418CFB|nr:sensor domain-containing diguanylate cyclase [Pararhizobium sp. IMCC3301]